MNDAVFVISEFNPFHFGHEHLVSELRKRFGTAVCLMSGEFVQRGTIACADKYLRAKAAVLCGADLVIELPFPYSCLSAADFARAGVSLGAALGARAFGFGAESPIEEIKKASAAADGASARALIAREKNLSYPKAVSKLLASAGLDPELLAKPNNILASEYLRAVNELAPGAECVAVKRESAFEPSSAIRAAMPENWEKLVPRAVYGTLNGSLVPENALDAVILSRWRMEEISEIYGADEGTLRRVKAAAASCAAVSEVCEKAVSAALTSARIRRTLINGFFGVTPDRARKAPSYALLLASNARGRAYLTLNKKSFAVPLITKPADYTSAGDEAVKDFEFALRAENVYALACAGYNPLSSTPFQL